MARKKIEDRELKVGNEVSDSPASADRSEIAGAVAQPVPAMRPVTDGGEIAMWPLVRLVPHPDNPRAVNTKSSRFLDLTESIKRNGVIEPLTVRRHRDEKSEFREAVGVTFLEVLSGHRRLEAARAAGLDAVPIRNLGEIPDDLAYDIVAMSNLHEDLTPLEEGRRAALWLDKYGQDARAVAAKLGKTERWVRLHAQIDRGLIPAWKGAAIEDRDGQFTRWTAAHWIPIARLPVKLQEYWLDRIDKSYEFNPQNATSDDVEEWIETEKLLLAKARFDIHEVVTVLGRRGSCEGCDHRTDAISQTLWAEPGDKDGEAVRCLDGKCWASKAAKACKEEFRVLAEAAVEKSNTRVPDPVPISMIEEPKDWSGRQEYIKKIKPIKKAFGKALVEAARIEVVKQGDKGAVPGIVVAGKGKGTLKWVRISEKPKDAGRGGQRPQTAAEVAQESRKKEKAARWDTVVKAAFLEMSKADRPADTAVLLCCLQAGTWPSAGHGFDKGTKELWARLLAYHDAGNMAEAVDLFMDASWAQFCVWTKQKSRYCYVDNDLPRLRDIAGLFGIDPDARYQALAAKETKKEKTKAPTEGGTPNAKGKGGRPKKAKEIEEEEEEEVVDEVDEGDGVDGEGGD